MSIARAISIRVALLATGAACCLLLASPGASSAQAARPWWHVSVSSRPSTITPGVARNEVELVTVAATGGDFYLENPVTEQRDILPPLPYDATSAEMQVALEGIYGAGNVEVPRGEGNAEGSDPYEVIFIGELAYRPVPLTAVSFPFAYEGYEPLTGEVTVAQKVVGRPDGRIVLLVTNLGDGSAEGRTEPVRISDALPSGLKATGIEGKTANPSAHREPVDCMAATLTCTFEGKLPAYEAIEVEIPVVAQEGAEGGEVDTATVEGGGAGASSGLLKQAYGSEPSFGVQTYEMGAEGERGGPVRVAGGHPFQLTTTTIMNQNSEGKAVGLTKDLEFDLPDGMMGNPTAYPQCSLDEFMQEINGQEDECSAEDAIGVADVTIRVQGSIETDSVPVFNLEPEAGEPARFGFFPAVPVVLDTAVRTGKGYGVTVAAHDLTELAGFLGAQVTLWGVPGSPAHDQQRGWGCLRSFEGELGYTCKLQEQREPAPFLSMPSACTGTMEAPLFADSWQRPGYFGKEPYKPVEPMPGLSGCNDERFEPTIKTSPDYEEASRPSGLSVDVHVPQELQTVAEGTAESAVKEIKVELPQGVTINPGGAGGLQACTKGEVGYEGKEEPEKEVAFEFFSPTLPEPFCPKQAKVGTVTIHTPLLPNPLEGAVYIASPAPTGEAGQNPYKSLLAMYLVAEDPISGTLVKLPMHVELNQATGQITTTVDNPELPFEDAELHFFGGSRAPLATPGLCGAYTTKAVFTPWSGQEPVTSTSTFHITSGPNEPSCPSNPKPFTPALNAGTVNNQAGSFSELRTTMGHPDEDQALGALKMTLPPGVSGLLSHVTLCPEPQASEGTCAQESLIGHTTVTAGLGSTPAIVARPGNVYITGPYDGAPYGLSIDNPAETGPFDLDKGTKCDCTVVRAKIEINPHTAQITVTTPATGTPGAIPTMLDGIPLDLQHVAVEINRPEFTFNPTNCEKMKVEGTITGAEGASVPISEPFQAANCAALKFAPKFKVFTKAHHTRKNGAYLRVVVESKQGQAGLHEVHVELPTVLPSRLPTLQKACTEQQFAANPAGCPAASVVGHAEIHTPVLPVPLKGPAYFVSHGGAKFPELIMVLQGYGTTIVLNGETFISKRGVTSSTFKETPDVPFNRFELILPAGEHSALAANGNLCAKPLYMPTRLSGQNGALRKQKTKIKVSGCKPAIQVLRREVKDATAKITVKVPAAGKLVASGVGISRVVKELGRAKTATLKVSLTAKDRRQLAKHPGHSQRVDVKLRFTPKNKNAKPISNHVTVLMK